MAFITQRGKTPWCGMGRDRSLADSARDQLRLSSRLTRRFMGQHEEVNTSNVFQSGARSRIVAPHCIVSYAVRAFEMELPGQEQKQ